MNLNKFIINNLMLVMKSSLCFQRYFVRPDGGFDPDYNVHHWAWSFALGYSIGRSLALDVNLLREISQGNHGAYYALDMSDIAITGIATHMASIFY